MPEPAYSPPASTGRPFALDPLFRPVQSISGVGPKLSPLLIKLVGGERIFDLLCHLPIDGIDRTYRPTLHTAQAGKIATITVDVIEHRPPKRGGIPYRIIAGDGIGYIDLVFFNPKGNYLETAYPSLAKVTISGKLERFGGKWQMVHPDLLTDDMLDQKFEPVYAMAAGITHRWLNRVMRGALAQVPILPEWIDPALLGREKWPAFHTALQTVHRPDHEQDVSPQAPIRRRLAYDELLANQVTLALVRDREKGLRGRAMPVDPLRRAKVLAVLPFTLTAAQEQAVAEIDADMAAPTRMMRLLQGDVGSGKTVVALLAMLNAVAVGAQAVLMAPTEILAQQHVGTLGPWLEKLGIPFVILTGRYKGRERDDILARIENGQARVIIGTHALFQDTVHFHDLGLAVIDEQHRFGVHQRLRLSQKGQSVDLLVMTATPIPRTLTLTAYGDLDVSRLTAKPPGRQPVDTRLIPLARLEEMIEGLGKHIKTGRQVYWVCPLVEESEVVDLAAAEERYADLTSRFGDQVGLIHGRMKPAEKDAVMTEFAAGQKKILVATTVIEVGVNVPSATVMVIEHAERFGLAQLHQLRGRVGRGSDQSYCFLLYTAPLSETAQERLKIMRDTEDGFVIAEKDLSLRGPGDILGAAQSGLATGRLSDLAHHQDLLDMARDDARLLVQKDPKLTSPRGQAVRHVLYLFERDQAIKLLQAG